MADKAKPIMAVALSGLSAVLGWQGILALVWVAAMLADFIAGTAAAAKCGDWCSDVLKQGAWRKFGSIVVVAVCLIVDFVFSLIFAYLPLGITWTSLLFPLVLSWYIVMELGSILENAVKMGANVPGWLIKILRISAQALEAEGDRLEEQAETVIDPKEE